MHYAGTPLMITANTLTEAQKRAVLAGRAEVLKRELARSDYIPWLIYDEPRQPTQQPGGRSGPVAPPAVGPRPDDVRRVDQHDRHPISVPGRPIERRVRRLLLHGAGKAPPSADRRTAASCPPRGGLHGKRPHTDQPGP